MTSSYELSLVIPAVNPTPSVGCYGACYVTSFDSLTSSSAANLSSLGITTAMSHFISLVREDANVNVKEAE